MVIHRSALEVGCKAACNITSNAAVGHIRNRAVFVTWNQVGYSSNQSVDLQQLFLDLCFIADICQTTRFGDCHKACRIAAVISCCYGFQVGDMSVFHFGAVAASDKACGCVVKHGVCFALLCSLNGKAILVDAVHVCIFDSDLYILTDGE